MDAHEIGLTAQRYRDFRPTGLDPKGLGLADRQDWLVVPIIRTRDSSILGYSSPIFLWTCTCLTVFGRSSMTDVTCSVPSAKTCGPSWSSIRALQAFIVSRCRCPGS